MEIPESDWRRAASTRAPRFRQKGVLTPSVGFIDQFAGDTSAEHVRMNEEQEAVEEARGAREHGE